MTALRCLLSISDEPNTNWRVVDRVEEVRHGSGGVWVSHPDYLISGEWGLIVGRLFARGGGGLVRSLPSDAPTASDATTLGRWITDKYWGGWIAVLRERENGRVLVARDPSSYLPIYRRRIAGRTLLATEVSELEREGTPPLSVSWPDLGAHLRYPEMRQSRTCLTHVTEVAPGAVSDLSDDGTTPVWHPWGFAKAAPTRDLAAVRATLRKTAIDCVSAWASLGGRVAVSASGGLDSSIVCACLAAAGHPFDCVTVSTPDPSGDESAHVRHLAAALGVRMIVKTFDPSTWQIETAASAGLPRPTRKAFMVQLRRLLREACDELGADTVFDGNGGDNLFCYLHSAAPIIDRLRDEGIDKALAGTFLDMCRVTECDISTMARAVAKRMWSGPKPYWRPDDRLLALRGDLPGQLTPWWSAGSRNLPGKAAHIGLIQRSQNFEHGLCGEGRPHRFSVLMSQPLMEACLAIPSWQWCAGGINRALARAAFRDDLPEAILARRSKAGPDSVLRGVFARNRSLIRDMLLGGLLVGNGVLDAHAVERALQMDEHSDDQIVNRLLDVAEAEAWSRSWA